MKALVLYDSKFGNTKIIAQTVAEVLAGQLVNINDFRPDIVTEMDVVVVGSPVHAWHPSETTNEFLIHLEKSELKGKYVAAFDTGYKSNFAGNAASSIMKALEKAGGTALIATHKFIVEHSEGPLGPEEIARADIWAHDLITQYERATQTSKLEV
jgi:flavodoxin